jgi:hypothetical protein
VMNLLVSRGTMFASLCQCVSPNPGGLLNTQLWYTRSFSSSSQGWHFSRFTFASQNTVQLMTASMVHVTNLTFPPQE